MHRTATLRGSDHSCAPVATVDRDALIARAIATDARLTSIVAPAGYGKSYVLRRAVAQYDGGMCDCADLGNVADLARRIIAALGPFASERADWIAAQIAPLRSGVEYDFAWGALVAELWSCGEGSAFVCFENADALSGNTPALAIVGRLLRDAPAGRRVWTAGRTDLRFDRLGRLAPHETHTIRLGDLAFADAEVAALFAGLDVAPLVYADLIAACKGWPVAVLSARRWARNDTLDAALAGARSESTDQLRAYYADESLTTVEPEIAAAMRAIVRLGSATRRDLALLFPRADAHLVATLAREPFVLVGDDQIAMHPLVRAAFPPDAEQTALLEGCARGYADAGDPLRAAQIYLRLGLPDAAATLLDGPLAPLVAAGASHAVTEIVANLDTETLVRHPATWCATIPQRMTGLSQEQLLAQVRRVWAAAHDAAPTVRVNVGCRFAHALAACGKSAEAEAVLGLLDVVASVCDQTSPESRYVLLTRGVFESASGRRVGTDALRSRLEPLFALQPPVRAMWEMDVEAQAAMRSGDRDAARRHLTAAVDLTYADGGRHRHALALTTAAFYAWLAGEDALFRTYVLRLRGDDDVAIRSLTKHFVTCCDGKLGDASIESLAVRAQGSYIAALATDDVALRRSSAQAGLSAAQAAGQPLLVLFGWIVVAITDPARSVEAWSAARVAAANVEDPRVARDVRALAAGERVVWMRAFADRIANRRRTLRVEFGSRRVSVGDRDVVLAPREALILTVLATRRGVVERARFAELISPDADPDDALNSLRVNVSRLRKRLEPYEAIVSERDGYRIGSDVVLDIDVCEKMVERLAHGGSPSDRERRMLAHLCSREDDTWPTWLYHEHQLVSAIARADRTIERARAVLEPMSVTIR